MHEKTDAKVTPFDKGKFDYTSVTFYPDFTRFEQKELTEDMLGLMRKRVYDVAGISPKKTRVHLNKKKVELSGFEEYAAKFITALGKEEGEIFKMGERINERWEVILAPSDGEFQQVSYVNGIATTRGGTHVTAIVD